MIQVTLTIRETHTRQQAIPQENKNNNNTTKRETEREKCGTQL